MMSEWHIPLDYIVNNWTDELLNLMVEKMVERKKKDQGSNEISDTQLFARAKGIRVIKSGKNK